MKVELHPEADEEFAARVEFYESQEPGLGQRFYREVIGCLERSPAGNWLLTNANAPILSETQATTSLALKTAQALPLGSQRYQLLGISFFKPSAHQHEKVAVKGIVIRDSKGARINLTSLQMLASTCGK